MDILTNSRKCAKNLIKFKVISEFSRIQFNLLEIKERTAYGLEFFNRNREFRLKFKRNQNPD